MNIVVKNLKKSFRDKTVLNNLSITLKEGHTTVIMGQSGCGKSTLLNILMGIMKPDEGIIEGIGDRRISVVFQEDRLCDEFDAVSNVKLVLREDPGSSQIIKDLMRVGLEEEDIVGKPVSKLSGGMKRRVAIIRAVMALEDILIMDEPFKGLDKENREKVISYINERVKDKTLIFTTHNIEDVETFKGELITIE